LKINFIFGSQIKQNICRLITDVCQILYAIHQNYIPHLKKKLLLLFFIPFCLSISGATYYIDPSGNDSNSGSSSSPWKTLAFACTKATQSGDIIHINAGTYVETNACLLAAGVSIEGDGVASAIKSHYVGGSDLNTAVIMLSGGSNSSQHISGIKLDGDGLTGDKAIVIYNRSNVSINNCEIVDFAVQGIRFDGGAQTGNSVYNNTITNSGGYTDDEHGNLALGCNTGILVYGNTITQNQRASGLNGLCIQGNNNLYGSKIYNNIITGLERNSTQSNWPFAVEFWNNSHIAGYGTEIYGNTIIGQVDFGSGVAKGSYPYGVYFHNNTLGDNSIYPADVGKCALQFEETVSDVIVSNNLFKNLDRPIYFCIQGPNQSFENIQINNNIFRDVVYGYAAQSTPQGYSAHGSGIFFGGGTPTYVRNVNIWNNTFVAYPGRPAEVGVYLPTSYDVDNINVVNNIFVGFTVAPIIAELQNGGGSLTTLNIQRNLYHNNKTNNFLAINFTPTDVTNDNGIIGNPLFVSSADFHLQANSPAIGKGLFINGLTTDYDGKVLNNPPSIGAFESGSIITPPTIPVYQNSIVSNSTPSLLEINYNLSLAIVVPSSAAFSVKVNSLTRNVNTVTISGTKILLTLASPVINGDLITVSYTKPISNPIQASSGGQAASISSETVTNNVAPGIPPVYSGSAVENGTPTTLEITYNLPLATTIPPSGAFNVTVNSVVRSVNTVAISGAKVLLTLVTPVIYGDVVTVAYTKPATNSLQTPSGGQVATFSAQSVTNRIINPVSLVYTNSAVGNDSPAKLEIYFNLSLANSLPSVSAFSVRANSNPINVTLVTISANSVILSLATEIVFGEVVTVSYTKPASNQLQSTSGLLASNFSAQSVTNKVDGPVYVSSVVENITPSIIEISYNESLDITAPPVSAFIVMVNGVKRDITSVSISGNKVLVMLATPVIYGDNITVSYIKPANNQLKKATGGSAVSFSFPQPVTNKLTSNSIKKRDINIYPIPAHDLINITLLEPSSESMTIRIFDFSGKLFSEIRVDPYISALQVPINLKSGNYILQIVKNSLILFTQKLIVMN
jgi:uncharacterized repeat protein (TIGR02059 family)